MKIPTPLQLAARLLNLAPPQLFPLAPLPLQRLALELPRQDQAQALATVRAQLVMNGVRARLDAMEARRHG
jgi:hypothetical protein